MRLRRITAALLVALGLSTPAASTALAVDMRPFTHDAGTTDIPVHPQRIVSMNDFSITIPLIELGVTPVGSSGRVAADGSVYIRSGMSLVATDFSNSSIQFVDAANVESIAALEPDLIIASSSDATLRAQLSLIAPTIILNDAHNPGLAQLRLIADAADALPAYHTLEARFLAKLDGLKTLIPDASQISVSILYAGDGVIKARKFTSSGGLGYLLEAVGFHMQPILQDAGSADMVISTESLRELDADFIIDTYSSRTTPAGARAALTAILPNWCDFLHACRNRQHIAVPTDEARATSFASLDLMLMVLQTHIAGREFVPLPVE